MSHSESGDLPNLIPESFSADERKRLLGICHDICFVDALETLRAEYACAMNNALALKVDRIKRRYLAGKGVDWALSQPVYKKLPSNPDVENSMLSIETQTKKLLRVLKACGYIEKSALHDAGLEEPDGLGRVIDDLEALVQAASRAQNFGAFPKDRKRQVVLQTLQSLADAFELWNLPVKNYPPSYYYDEGKAAKGGPFWRAAVIVLSHKPHPQQLVEFFQSTSC